MIKLTNPHRTEDGELLPAYVDAADVFAVVQCKGATQIISKQDAAVFVREPAEEVVAMLAKTLKGACECGSTFDAIHHASCPAAGGRGVGAAANEFSQALMGERLTAEQISECLRKADAQRTTPDGKFNINPPPLFPTCTRCGRTWPTCECDGEP